LLCLFEFVLRHESLGDIQRHMKKDLPVVGRHRRAEAKVEFGSRVGLSDKLRGLKDGIGSRHQRDNSTLAIKEIQFRTSSGPTSQKAVYAMRPDGSQHQA